MAADTETYKRAISRFPTGVGVIATQLGERRAGMTVNALFSLSVSPPSIVVSMQKGAESTKLLKESRFAALSFLSGDQERLSELFSRHDSTKEKFGGGGYHPGSNGQPVLDGAIASLELEVTDIFPAEDHELFVCRVTSVEHCDDRLPLIYWGGRYGTVSGGKTIDMPEPK